MFNVLISIIEYWT